jgi:hypothetical protein
MGVNDKPRLSLAAQAPPKISATHAAAATPV